MQILVRKLLYFRSSESLFFENYKILKNENPETFTFETEVFIFENGKLNLFLELLKILISIFQFSQKELIQKTIPEDV